MMLVNLLKNQIDIVQVPFSDRGSRLMVYKEKNRSRLYIKLAERLMKLDPDLEAHLHRPPFIQDLSLLGPNGEVLDFSIETSPGLLEFKTSVGKFGLAFRDETTLAFGLPPNTTSGISFKVRTDRYQVMEASRESHPIRHVSSSTNGVILKDRTVSVDEGEIVEIFVRTNANCTLQLHISDRAVSTDVVPPFSVIRAAAQERWQAW